jgi:hypothetical protein
MYFKKLNFTLPNLDISRIKGDYIEGYGPTFKLYDIKDIEYFDNLIASKIKFHIPPVVKCFVEISDGGTNAHIDHHSVSLNYYVDPATGLTLFWTPKAGVNSQVVHQILDDGTLQENTVRSWEFEDLNFASSFMAKSHEAFLLDIKKIHSVAKFHNAPMRSMLSWRWFFQDFDTIVNSIEILD